MSAMAVADLAMVDIGLLRQWVYFLFDVDIRAQTSFGCKLHILLTYYTHQVRQLRQDYRSVYYFPTIIHHGNQPRYISCNKICISLLSL